MILIGCGKVFSDPAGRNLVPRASLRICRYCSENCFSVLQNNARVSFLETDLSKDPVPVEVLEIPRKEQQK